MTLALGLAAPTGGCAYRFSNLGVVRPTGIRTIAVEAVYDTSREVLPHEVLWEELQKAFAAEGHLRLIRQQDADALLRAHVRTAGIAPSGSPTNNGPVRDPKVFERGADDPPPPPSAFKPLTQAGELRNAATLTLVVDVEVWNLRTRTLLTRKSFNLASEFRAVHADGPGTYTTRNNDFLRYDEAAQAGFRRLAQNISQSVVQDLLIR